MFKNYIKYIAISLFCISLVVSCSAKNVKNTVEPNKPIEQKKVEIEQRPLQTCHYPEYCFDTAMKDYKDGKGAEAVRGFLAVADGFPDSIWRKRALFMIGRIFKEGLEPL